MKKDKISKLEIKQVFDAPIEKVWDAWTSPENLRVWKAPEGMHTPEVDVDLKRGGKYRIVMEWDQKSHRQGQPDRVTVGGQYLEIKRPKKLVFSWLWEGSPKGTPESIVTVLLKKVDKSKTEVTLTHDGLLDNELRKEHKIGWVSTFRKLANFLSQK